MGYSTDSWGSISNTLRRMVRGVRKMLRGCVTNGHLHWDVHLAHNQFLQSTRSACGHVCQRFVLNYLAGLASDKAVFRS